MTPDVVVALALIGGSVVFLAASLLIGLCRAAAKKRPPIAAPAPDQPLQRVQGRASTHCSVPFCDDPVQVIIPVGHDDRWEFCLPHGLPYLTEQSAQQRKDGAA